MQNKIESKIFNKSFPGILLAKFQDYEAVLILSRNLLKGYNFKTNFKVILKLPLNLISVVLRTLFASELV